jgi:glycerol uptake facilitator protein
MAPWIGEVIGTAILILLGNGVVANVVLPQTKGHNSGWIVIAWGWGMAVFVAVWCSAAVSGAHLNPAVSLGLALAGKFAWAEVPMYVAAQMLGAFLGAVLVWLAYRDHFAACDDADAQMAAFCTAPAIRNYLNNSISEIIGTFVLVFAVLSATEPSLELPLLSATAQSDLPKLGLGTIGALPVGLLVLAIGLSLGGTTGYAINPARDLAPRIAHALLPLTSKRDSDWSYAPIPVVAPCVGAALAALLFAVIGATN